MRRGSYIVGWINRAGNAISAVRWRDPLVQSWGLIGVLMVAGITAHYVAARGPGEKKNRGEWTAAFAAVVPVDEWQPGVVMAQPHGESAVPESASGIDLRALAAKAAARDRWEYIPSLLRAGLRQMPVEVPRITVMWSHTAGGDAEALSLYHRTTLGLEKELPFDFVIGNGKRSRDGHIEALPRWSSGQPVPAEGIRICLAGHPGEPTAAQQAALGELIISLEARCGTLPLAMHQPERPEAIAANTGR